MRNLHDIELTELGSQDLNEEDKQLTPGDVEVLLERVPEWSRDGEPIGRVFEFENFVEAVAFVNRVAEVAEAENHHPDIDIRYNKVRLALTTHNAGGLTLADFIVAAKIDTLV